MDTALVKRVRDRIVENCSKVILGKEEAIEKVLISYLCRGHVLLEDLPGTGKTMLLRSFSRSIRGDFKRVQFTPDLMPGDLTGIHFYSQKTCEFEFRPGPLFADVVLADEINRATPRTQSSLLEAMEERQITVDGTTYQLPYSYFVMATQNPMENYGTFPLPEAQTDRFFMRMRLGYMERSQEIAVMKRQASTALIEELSCVVTEEEITAARAAIGEVTISDEVAGYLMDLIDLTRDSRYFSCGASARGTISLFHASQAKAAFSGRDYVIPEDIRSMAVPILAHRLPGDTLQVEAQLEKILDQVPVPTEEI